MPAVDRVIGIGSPHGDDVAGWPSNHKMKRLPSVSLASVFSGQSFALNGSRQAALSWERNGVRNV